MDNIALYRECHINGKENTKEALEIEKRKSKKTSMNLKTALSLSLNNLLTKKGRTIFVLPFC